MFGFFVDVKYKNYPQKERILGKMNTKTSGIKVRARKLLYSWLETVYWNQEMQGSAKTEGSATAFLPSLRYGYTKQEVHYEKGT